MRNQIISMLRKYDLEDQFFVGDGAESGMSFIRFKVEKWNPQLLTANYALQFEPRTKKIVIWDIRKRIAQSASLDLYIKKSMQWDMITHLQIFTVYIGNRGSANTSQVAVMPFEQLEDFLLTNKYYEFGIPVVSDAFEEDDLKSLAEDNAQEGKSVFFYGKRYERNAKLREAAIRIHGYRCNICGFDFAEKYGDVGKDYIEVHHVKPLYQGLQDVNPETDMICVCANCHRMIHRKKTAILQPEELERMIQK